MAKKKKEDIELDVLSAESEEELSNGLEEGEGNEQ
jgi:hypothetical protein